MPSPGGTRTPGQSLGGRPTKLRQLVTVPATTTEPERRIPAGDYICELMAKHGTRAELCARTIGVDRHTVEQWLTAGNRADEKQHKGHKLTTVERQYLHFLLATRAAHATWVHETTELHRQIAAGGLVIGKIIEKVDPTRFETDAAGQPVIGADGQPRPLVIERRVEQSRTLPDGQALRWELERLARDIDGSRLFAPRVELTGADGEQLVGSESRAEREQRLFEELSAYKQGLDDQRDRDSERRGSNGRGNGAEP